MQDEAFDLRPILANIGRNWHTIVAAAILAALVTTGLVLTQPRRYTATAAVLLRPTASAIALDARFVTSEQTDAQLYRQSMLAIAGSAAIETGIPQDVIDQIANGRQGLLVKQISVSAKGNLLSITATATTAAGAKQLADAWTEAFVRYANAAFGESIASSEAIELQLRDARTQVTTTQDAYEQYLATTTIGELDHEIALVTSTLESARKADQERYSSFLSRIQNIDLLIDDVAALRTELATTNSVNLGDRLASLGLRARASNSGTLPFQIQVAEPQLLDAAEEVTPARLSALEAQLRQQRATLQAAATSLSATLTNASVGATTALSSAEQSAYLARLRELQYSRETEYAKQLQLEQNRNIALETLQVVQRKLAEQQVTATTGEAQARIANSALLPIRPASRQVVLKVAASLITGALIGIVMTLVPLPSRGSNDKRSRGDAERYQHAAEAN